jgi:hypothetical protein
MALNTTTQQIEQAVATIRALGCYARTPAFEQMDAAVQALGRGDSSAYQAMLKSLNSRIARPRKLAELRAAYLAS